MLFFGNKCCKLRVPFQDKACLLVSKLSGGSRISLGTHQPDALYKVVAIDCPKERVLCIDFNRLVHIVAAENVCPCMSHDLVSLGFGNLVA